MLNVNGNAKNVVFVVKQYAVCKAKIKRYTLGCLAISASWLEKKAVLTQGWRGGVSR